MSTRPTRKSARVSSPYNLANGNNSSAPAAEPEAPARKKTLLEQWVEPPVRQPQPSFQDYKGIEPHGVLEQMAPLGTLPTVKTKTKGKGDGSRRSTQLSTQLRNGGSSGSKERPSTPDPPPVSQNGRRRSESRRM